MNSAKKVAVRGMLVAAAFVLGWLETQIPVFIAVPGVKLGLTNVVVLIALYRLGVGDALVINLIRIVLTGLTFGSLFSMWYSLAGGLLGTVGMIALKKCRAGTVTVSVCGGVLHNLGQLLVAYFVLESSSLFYYMVILWISGIISGAAVGMLGALIIKRLSNFHL